MASPIRDQVTFHHTPTTGTGPEEVGALTAPDVELAPVEPAHAPSGGLMRAFYDSDTKTTFTLAVTHGAAKRYLALPETAWRAMLQDLRTMHGQAGTKTLIDLSTRWVVGFDDELGNFMYTHQIDRDAEPERFTALTSIRSYLVQNRYAEAPSDSIADGYDLRAGARSTFAAREARQINVEELHRRIDRMVARKEEFQDWITGVPGDNPTGWMEALFEALEAERNQLQEQKAETQRLLQGTARENLRQVEAINRDLAQLSEKLSAIEHTTEIFWASALLHHPYDHEEQIDWRVPLQMAFDAKSILLEHFRHNAKQPISNEDVQLFEKRATDIAALLIPTTLGQGNQARSGEALVHLFYAGGETLSDLARPDTPERALPVFTPVALPQAAGHRYLREVLTQFHTDHVRPVTLPSAQDFFNQGLD